MPLSKPYPALSFGSVGEAVLLLQRALNVAPTKLPRLKEDSNFGPKTRGRVMEFQGQKNVVKDGVVGPVTWAQLEPFVKELLKILDKNFPAAGDENALRQRIVDVAKASFDTWGWGADKEVTPDGSARIAAARGVGPTMAGRRARQGGVALASIYAMAGAGGDKCLTIATTMENVYQQDVRDPVVKEKRRNAINQEDIGSWCGIFATYCYRAAGLKVSWDLVRLQSADYFEKLGANDAVRKGDIGVCDKQTNHHFIVVRDASPGEHVHSIDGNVGNPSEMTVSPWNSVISTRYYKRVTLAGKAGIFLRPRFGAMR